MRCRAKERKSTNNSIIIAIESTLGHIYTNMTFGLFTNIAPVGSLEHIYIYVPSSDERFSPGLQHLVLTGCSLLGTRHPVITGSSVVGYSTSGSHRVFLAGYSSSGSHRVFRCPVLHIRFSPGLPLPGTPHPVLTRSSDAGPLYPIRRDQDPNKLPLHSGMGCLVNPIRFWHASSLSGVSILFSICDPFSSVWIFVSTNS